MSNVGVLQKIGFVIKRRPFLCSLAQQVYWLGRRLTGFLKSLVLLNVRLLVLETEELPRSFLEQMRTDPGFNEILADLAAFTGLTDSEIAARVLRKPREHYLSEFSWRSPQTLSQLIWYYQTSYAYLFANAAHPYWTKLDLLDPRSGPVLDYAGGIGNNVITLARRGFSVDFLEISIIQGAFVRYRAGRRSLTNISFISPYVDSRFDPISCVRKHYAAIVLQQCLQHIPDHHHTLWHLIDHLVVGGLIFESSYFDPTAPDVAIRTRASIPLETAMVGMERIEPGVWRKKSEAVNHILASPTTALASLEPAKRHFFH